MTQSAPSCRRMVYYAGSVQGVGFRYTTRRIAQRFPVAGYVRNLPDGRVELIAEGTEAEVGRFLSAVDDAMAGYVRRKDVTEEPATGEFAGFEIRH